MVICLIDDDDDDDDIYTKETYKFFKEWTKKNHMCFSFEFVMTREEKKKSKIKTATTTTTDLNCQAEWKKNLNRNIIYIKMAIKNKKLKGECREIGSHLFILFFLLIDWLICDENFLRVSVFSIFFVVVDSDHCYDFFGGVGKEILSTYTKDKLNPECHVCIFLAWFYGTKQNPFCHQTTEQQKKNDLLVLI